MPTLSLGAVLAQPGGMLVSAVLLWAAIGASTHLSGVKERRPVGTDTQRVLRIGYLVDEDHRSLLRGIRFGIDEATRSAALFGWRVESHAVDAATLRTPARSVDAVVLGVSLMVSQASVPVLRIIADSAHGADRALRIAHEASDGRVEWLPTLERFGAAQLNARFQAATGAAMTRDDWLGWFAVKILAETALRERSATAVTREALLRGRFDGHKGEVLRFDERGVLIQPLYVPSSR